MATTTRRQLHPELPPITRRQLRQSHEDLLDLLHRVAMFGEEHPEYALSLLESLAGAVGVAQDEMRKVIHGQQ